MMISEQSQTEMKKEWKEDNWGEARVYCFEVTLGWNDSYQYPDIHACIVVSSFKRVEQIAKF